MLRHPDGGDEVPGTQRRHPSPVWPGPAPGGSGGGGGAGHGVRRHPPVPGDPRSGAEKNPVEKNTVAGKAAKAKEKELEEWLRGLDGMDRLVDDYVGDKIPLWEKIMDRQGTVCCTWEKTAFEEGLKVGIRLMMEVYSL